MESPLALPDASYAVVERACRRGNDANLITRGISALIQDLGAFTGEALRAAPKKLMRTARILGGTLRPPARSEIARRCREHPLFQLDPLALPVEEACSRIREYCGDGYSNPIPARLSAWWRGEISLSPGRLQRYHRVLSERLLLTRLGLIEQLAIERLREGLQSEGVAPTERHALLMLGSIEENRRGLRKFLSAYWSGDREYLSTHPATLAWYRKHKAVPRDLWEHGIEFQPGQGLTIHLEHDPFEILKLGTYVGTCLGVGGICCDSAAAALLDANKKVLYARDQRGRVVARQLLAIADDDRLVCFSVYPLSCPSTIKSAFRDYDYAFARAMDLLLYQPSESDESGYRVSSVLSVYWWDDCSWDFKTGE
jgi:hypothetical protein